MASAAASITHLTLKDAAFAHYLVAKHETDEDNIIRSTNWPGRRLLERFKADIQNPARMFYPVGVAQDNGLLYAIRTSFWTLQNVAITGAELTCATGTQRYRDEVTIWQQRPNNPFVNRDSWTRDDFHHPHAAATILSSLQKISSPVRLVICKAQSTVDDDPTNHELEVYDSLYSDNSSPIVWVHATSDPHGGNKVKYAGLADRRTFNRNIMNLAPTLTPNLPSTLDHWWAPHEGEEDIRVQQFTDIPSHAQLLKLMGIWPSDDNAQTRGGPLGWRFLTPTQIAEMSANPNAHRTMIWNRAKAALKCYFGADITAAFVAEWDENSDNATGWRPARTLRGLLKFPL